MMELNLLKDFKKYLLKKLIKFQNNYQDFSFRIISLLMHHRLMAFQRYIQVFRYNK